MLLMLRFPWHFILAWVCLFVYLGFFLKVQYHSIPVTPLYNSSPTMFQIDLYFSVKSELIFQSFLVLQKALMAWLLTDNIPLSLTQFLTYAFSCHLPCPWSFFQWPPVIFGTCQEVWTVSLCKYKLTYA